MDVWCKSRISSMGRLHYTETVIAGLTRNLLRKKDSSLRLGDGGSLSAMTIKNVSVSFFVLCCLLLFRVVSEEVELPLGTSPVLVHLDEELQEDLLLEELFDFFSCHGTHAFECRAGFADKDALL